VQRGGSGEQGGRVVDQFWGGGEEEAHRKNELSEVWTAGGERQWGRRPGVVVGSSRCGKVVHGGAMLGVWSRRSKRGQIQAIHGGLAPVSKAVQGRSSWQRRKRSLHGG
jgi:hypothetical protein